MSRSLDMYSKGDVNFIQNTPIDNQICSQCTKEPDGQEFVTCDSCNKGYHLRCLHLDRKPVVYWYCRACMRIIRKNGPLDITQEIDKLLSIVAAKSMGITQVEIDGQTHRWEDRLYVRKPYGYLEYPPIGKRWALIEDLHESHMHIGSEKMYQNL